MVVYMEDSGGSPDWIRELSRLACPLGSGDTPGSTRGGVTGFRKGGKLPESGRGRWGEGGKLGASRVLNTYKRFISVYVR